MMPFRYILVGGGIETRGVGAQISTLLQPTRAKSHAQVAEIPAALDQATSMPK